VENTDLSLRPGMTATADITVQKVEDVVLIPNAALRFTPPTPAERKPASGGGLLDALLPHPRRRESQRRGGNTGSRDQQRIWTLQGGQLVPVAVTTGTTDGVLTEVTRGDVSPGMPLVVDNVGGK
jgi:HlyD family secretion protein